jgi:hypothetical protein
MVRPDRRRAALGRSACVAMIGDRPARRRPFDSSTLDIGFSLKVSQARIECLPELILVGEIGRGERLAEVELELLGQAAETREQVAQTDLFTGCFVIAIGHEHML